MTQGCIIHCMLHPVVVCIIPAVNAIVDIARRRRPHVAELDVRINIGHAPSFGLGQMRVLIVGVKYQDEVYLKQKAEKEVDKLFDH